MGSSETEEQLRVRALLADTITLLCKNGLSFKQNMTIQGLIGITLDSNVFLVHLNENFRGEQADSSDIVMSPSVMSPAPSSDGGRRSPKRKRRRSSDNRSKQRKDSAEFDPDVRIKPEPEDIILIEEVKTGDREQSSCMLDEGLNFAVGSIQSFQQQAQGGASSSAAGGLSSASDSFQSTYQSSGGLDTSHGPGMSRAGPFVTGIVPHQTSASGQSNQGNETASGSFSWEGNPQGSHGNQPGTANWAGQLASQTMSSQGTSQTLPNIPPGASTSAGGRTLLAAGLRMTTRATRTELSLKEKLELINIAETTNQSNRALAKLYSIGKTQVGNILKRRHQIRDAINRNRMASDRKRYNYYSSHFGQVNQLTWEWYQALLAISIPVTGTMIQEKAKEYALSLGITDFKASNGWLDSFKKRHSIGNHKTDKIEPEKAENNTPQPEYTGSERQDTAENNTDFTDLKTKVPCHERVDGGDVYDNSQGGGSSSETAKNVKQDECADKGDNVGSEYINSMLGVSNFKTEFDT